MTIFRWKFWMTGYVLFRTYLNPGFFTPLWYRRDLVEAVECDEDPNGNSKWDVAFGPQLRTRIMDKARRRAMAVWKSNG